ncbi:MAG: Ni/Fe-hydrogenase, b-type cytochrome subunit [Arcanobacterium sp.]|nr:Ni/Fe-hydrogenase, b-type cytochrome subunit [Arcanobacterium sp.]
MSAVESTAIPAKQLEFSAFYGQYEAIEVGGGFNIGRVSMRRLLSMAAVSSEDSRDAVDLALRQAVSTLTPGMAARTVPASDFEPARADRRYSLARVKHFESTEGQFEDLVIMRGDLETVLNVSQPSRENRTLMRKNAQMARTRGYRCLAVAASRLRPDGTMGKFHLEGFINVRPLSAQVKRGRDQEAGPQDWVQLNLWSGLLRTLHWLNVALIFTLSCTGYYIMDPFFGDSFFRGINPGFLMGIFRFIHFVAAFTWLAVGVVRLVLAFVSKDRYMRWSTFWPLKSKQDVKYLGQTAAHYLFLRDEAPLYLAHNPLQQLTYTGIYVIGFVQMLTGLCLYGLYHMSNPIWRAFAMPALWIGIPGVRLVHAMIMFIFWAFVIAHIYLAFRADSLDRHGGISAMVGGTVWLKRGSKPVDAPEV